MEIDTKIGSELELLAEEFEWFEWDDYFEAWSSLAELQVDEMPDSFVLVDTYGERKGRFAKDCDLEITNDGARIRYRIFKSADEEFDFQIAICWGDFE